MHIRHQEVVVADAGRLLLAAGAVNGDILANPVVVADEEVAALVLELAVLRRRAEYCPVIDRYCCARCECSLR
jgi:hypothetical protein